MVGYTIERAEQHLEELSKKSDCELALIRASTLGRWFGFVFFYTSREYLETGDEATGLVGNAPFVVEKDDGKVVTLSSACPLEESISNYLRDAWLRKRSR